MSTLHPDTNPNDPGHYVTYGPDKNCTLAVCPVTDSIYEYQPSLAASSVFIALFGISLIIHLAQGIRYRTWTFMTAMLLGCVSEEIGYGGRIMLQQDPFSFNGFLIQIGKYYSPLKLPIGASGY